MTIKISKKGLNLIKLMFPNRIHIARGETDCIYHNSFSILEKTRKEINRKIKTFEENGEKGDDLKDKPVISEKNLA